MSYPKSYQVLHATHFSAGDSSLQKASISGPLHLNGVQIKSPESGDCVYACGQGLIVAPKSTLGSLCICMPKAPCHGQVLYLSFTQDIKNISYKSPVSFANKSQLACAAAGDNITLIYNQEYNKWFKLTGSGCSCAPSPDCCPADTVADTTDAAPAPDASED